jgi:hypothetical protein
MFSAKICVPVDRESDGHNMVEEILVNFFEPGKKLVFLPNKYFLFSLIWGKTIVII